MYQELKEQVCRANIELQKQNLVIYSFGNVSQIDRSAGVVAIKPSGVSYADLTADMIVLLDLDGKIVEGDLNPSSDTPTHLELYRSFESIGGVCHTHSPNATIWAQACREIPCLGTTHADQFYGPIPVTPMMTAEQIQDDYESNTGKVIVQRFEGNDPMQMPAILVAGHGPFTWGNDANQSVVNAVILEQVSGTALGTMGVNPGQKQIPQVLLDKHYLRKHGTDAYYGQK